MAETLKNLIEMDSAVLENAVKIETSDALKQAAEGLGETVEIQMTVKAYDYMKLHKVTFKVLREKFAESGVASYGATKNVLFALYVPEDGNEEKIEQLVIHYTVEGEANVMALYNAKSGSLLTNVAKTIGLKGLIEEQIRNQP